MRGTGSKDSSVPIAPLPLVVLLVAGLLGACGADSHSQETSMELDPATAAYQKHGYNELPVEARLGPHRFLIPANYFRDQIGPDFQGNFGLLVQWPDLQPLPPGKRSGQDMDSFDRQITITPRYVDRVPIEDLLERMAMPVAEPGTVEHDDPRTRLDLMVEQPGRHGITPYLVDVVKLEAYASRYRTEIGIATTTTPETYKDWFVRRNQAGGLSTLILCDPVFDAGDHRRPQCTHEFTIPQLKVAVSLDYPREYLSDWERIEARARGLLKQYQAGDITVDTGS